MNTGLMNIGLPIKQAGLEIVFPEYKVLNATTTTARPPRIIRLQSDFPTGY